mmetsp:Transcript_7220/g.29439  ORF Transcript_7220/g.29439 Transcript_7220/m.29439 type:complete len:361 (+) Transcript_7220:569-1651(+)
MNGVAVGQLALVLRPLLSGELRVGLLGARRRRAECLECARTERPRRQHRAGSAQQRMPCGRVCVCGLLDLAVPHGEQRVKREVRGAASCCRAVRSSPPAHVCTRGARQSAEAAKQLDAAARSATLGAATRRRLGGCARLEATGTDGHVGRPRARVPADCVSARHTPGACGSSKLFRRGRRGGRNRCGHAGGRGDGSVAHCTPQRGERSTACGRTGKRKTVDAQRLGNEVRQQRALHAERTPAHDLVRAAHRARALATAGLEARHTHDLRSTDLTPEFHAECVRAGTTACGDRARTCAAMCCRRSPSGAPRDPRLAVSRTVAPRVADVSPATKNAHTRVLAGVGAVDAGIPAGRLTEVHPQ